MKKYKQIIILFILILFMFGCSSFNYNSKLVLEDDEITSYDSDGNNADDSFKIEVTVKNIGDKICYQYRIDFIIENSELYDVFHIYGYNIYSGGEKKHTLIVKDFIKIDNYNIYVLNGDKVNIYR